MTTHKQQLVRRSRERGSSHLTFALALGLLLMMLLLVVGGMRIIGTNGDVEAAARAGARAASQAYDPAAGQAAATRVVADALEDRGVACIGFSVVTSGDWSPGSTIRVDVTCTIDLSDVALAGFPGTRQTTGTGIEVIDRLRGGE